MKKITSYLLTISMCFIIMGCTAQKSINLDRFSEVSIGTNVAQLEKQLGKPNKIHTKNSSEMVYEYTERLRSENRILMTRHYLFVIQNGQVVSKKVVYDTTNFEDRNAYDLQTSQRE